MNWVTYKNRTSSAYKFSTDDRNDPVIDELKAAVKVMERTYPPSIRSWLLH